MRDKKCKLIEDEIEDIIMHANTNPLSMNDFMRVYWKEYILPVGMPMVVFIVSFFGTNIGWAAFPIGLVVCAVMALLTTVKIRNRERYIEMLMLNQEAYLEHKASICDTRKLHD